LPKTDRGERFCRKASVESGFDPSAAASTAGHRTEITAKEVQQAFMAEDRVMLDSDSVLSLRRRNLYLAPAAVGEHAGNSKRALDMPNLSCHAFSFKCSRTWIQEM
jgi:hypothetical protein